MWDLVFKTIPRSITFLYRLALKYYSTILMRTKAHLNQSQTWVTQFFNLGTQVRSSPAFSRRKKIILKTEALKYPGTRVQMQNFKLYLAYQSKSRVDKSLSGFVQQNKCSMKDAMLPFKCLNFFHTQRALKTHLPLSSILSCSNCDISNRPNNPFQPYLHAGTLYTGTSSS